MKKTVLFFILLIFLLLIALFSISVGTVNIPAGEILHMFKNFVTGNTMDTMNWNIVFQIRLPRVLVAILVGASLSVAGVTYQGFLRNPLADPYILGVSAGSALGAGISFWLKLDQYFSFISPTPLAAFGGALLAIIVVYRISIVRGKLPVDTFLLAGVIVSSFFGALVSILMIVSQEDIHKLIFWMMGSFAEKDWSNVFLILPYVIMGGILLFINAKKLNIITLGDEQAHYMGIDVEKTKLMFIASASLITAAAVSAGGVIGFVGLIVPHVVRMFTGADHRVLFPFSACAGAIFLVISDDIARCVLSPAEIPVGVVTALFGAPFFCYLLMKRKVNFYH